MSDKELQRAFRKYGITARKWGGDDLYSWAVFIWGDPKVTGLGKSQVMYYKKLILSQLERKSS